MIRILVVDDEEILRNGAAKIIAKCEPAAEIVVCASGFEALEEAKVKPFDIAFCDVEMPEMTGLQLAKRLKSLSPKTNIIFCTAYAHYAIDAMKLHASGYIVKPATLDKVKKELENLRHPIDDGVSGLRVQTFGDFEVYHDGKPLNFKYAKTKEMFAYLIDRNGAFIDSGELQSVLWEGEEDKTSYLMRLRKDLQDTLKSIGEGGTVISKRGGIALVPTMIKCDYFDLLAGSEKGSSAYQGDYMLQYDWAAATNDMLDEKYGSK